MDAFVFSGTVNVLCRHTNDAHEYYFHDIPGTGKILLIYSEPFEAERKVQSLGDGYVVHTMATYEETIDLLLDIKNLGIPFVTLDPGVKGSQSNYFSIDNMLAKFSDKRNLGS